MTQPLPVATIESPGFWQRYRESINLKQDLRAIFIRSHDRYATLDGVRAFTILLMVLLHVIFGAGLLMYKNGVLDEFIQGIPHWFSFAFQAQGSDPLFIICGLLVSYTLFREYDRQQQLDFRQFYKRRIMRIYPLFLLALVIYFPSYDFVESLNYLPANLIFMGNLFPGQKPIIPVGWSLEAQIQFYVMLPFLLLLMYRLPCRVVFLVGLILISFAWRYWLVASNPEIYSKPFYTIFYDEDFAIFLADILHYDLDARIGNFFLGMLIAYLHYYHKQRIQKFFRHHSWLNLGLLLLAAYFIAWSIGQPVQDRTSSYYANITEARTFWFLVADRYVYCLGISILLIQMLCPTGASHVLGKFFSLPVWHPFAQLIYPIYLFHFPIIIVAAIVTFGTVDITSIPVISLWQILVLFFWSVLFTMIFSTAAHLFLEKPFITMRDK